VHRRPGRRGRHLAIGGKHGQRARPTGLIRDDIDNGTHGQSVTLDGTESSRAMHPSSSFFHRPAAPPASLA
jgi:hypothetical protein